MSKKVAVMLAEGFELVEAMAPVDAMRRAGIEVTTVSVEGAADVLSGSGVTVTVDKTIDGVDLQSFDMLVVPGGSLGVDNLKKSHELAHALTWFMQNNKHVAAICAGPSVLAELGLLEGRQATCYPGVEESFPDGVYQDTIGVFVDKNLITASGPGQALDFGIAIIKALCGERIAEDVAQGMLVKA